MLLTLPPNTPLNVAGLFSSIESQGQKKKGKGDTPPTPLTQIIFLPQR